MSNFYENLKMVQSILNDTTDSEIFNYELLSNAHFATKVYNELQQKVHSLNEKKVKLFVSRLYNGADEEKMKPLSKEDKLFSDTQKTVLRICKWIEVFYHGKINTHITPAVPLVTNPYSSLPVLC